MGRRSYWFGVCAFVTDLSLLTLATNFAVSSTNLAVKLLCSILAGFCIGALFLVGHDAAHNSLTPNRTLNRILGRLAFIPSLHSYELWVHGHNRIHHRWTNLATKDYVWTPLSLAQYWSISRPEAWLYRFYRSGFGILAYYLVEIWLKKVFIPLRSAVDKVTVLMVLDSCLVVAAAFSYPVVLIALNQDQSPWSVLFFGAVLPFFVWNAFASFVIYLHHTHPNVVWYNREEEWHKKASQVELTTHVVFPVLVRVFMHSIMEHGAHHRNMNLPFYELESAQRQIETEVGNPLQTVPAYFGIADSKGPITVMRWSFRRHLDIVRCCKLYDFDNKQWRSFDGKYTS